MTTPEVVPGVRLFLARSELGRLDKATTALAIVAATVLLSAGFFRRFDGLFAGATLVSQGIVMWSGLLIVSQMFARRAALRARWGDRAFSVAFRWFAVPGLTLIGAGVAHFAWIEGSRWLPREAALVPAVYLLLTGLALWWRAVMTFGIDNLSLLYVYFPAEGRLVQSNVYSVLRHPVYSAVLRIAFALCLLNGSLFALFASFVAPLTMAAWVRRVEEPELVERFGEDYLAYRARVPAFFNWQPGTWPVLWRFMLGGG